jgi:hypothetical protein
VAARVSLRRARSPIRSPPSCSPGPLEEATLCRETAKASGQILYTLDFATDTPKSDDDSCSDSSADLAGPPQRVTTRQADPSAHHPQRLRRVCLVEVYDNPVFRHQVAFLVLSQLRVACPGLKLWHNPDHNAPYLDNTEEARSTREEALVMVPKCVVLQAQQRPAFTIKCTDCSADHRLKIQGT